MEAILEHHKDKEILYTLNEEAEGIFEVITDKLNDQFNLKYTSSSQISASQPDLDNAEKSELSVRTKATDNNRMTDLYPVGLLQRLVMLQFSLHAITFRNVYHIKLFI